MKIFMFLAAAFLSPASWASPALETPLAEVWKTAEGLRVGKKPLTFLATKTISNYFPTKFFAGNSSDLLNPNNQMRCFARTAPALTATEANKLFLNAEGGLASQAPWKSAFSDSMVIPYNFQALWLLRPEKILTYGPQDVVESKEENRTCISGHWVSEGPYFHCDEEGPVISYSLRASLQLNDGSFHLSCSLLTKDLQKTRISWEDFLQTVGDSLELVFPANTFSAANESTLIE